MKHPGYTLLAWDSRCFGFPVAAAHCPHETPPKLDTTLKAMRAAKVKLAYLNVEPSDVLTNEAAVFAGGTLVDHKLTYEIALPTNDTHPTFEPTSPVEEYHDRQVCPDLLRLAFIAGRFSRFRSDARIPADRFEFIYRTWIERAVSGSLADKVLVTRDSKGSVDAMITLRMTEGTGRIGLIAVATKQQGRGRGTALISNARTFFSAHRCSKLQVVTQASNIPACHFYERCGFNVAQAYNVYHLWFD